MWLDIFVIYAGYKRVTNPVVIISSEIIFPSRCSSTVADVGKKSKGYSTSVVDWFRRLNNAESLQYFISKIFYI